MEKYSIYVILTRSNTLFSKLIQAVKKDEYTHAALSFEEDLSKMYSFGRKYAFLPLVGRLGTENLEEGVFKKHDHLPGVVIEVKVNKWQYDRAKSLLDDFLENSAKYKYHYFGVVNHLLKREVTYDDKFLCSDFVYFILNKIGILSFQMSRNLVRPQNIFWGLSHNVIFQGDLKEFNLAKKVAEWNDLKDELEYDDFGFIHDLFNS
jgi:hypothetical protein